MACGQGTQAGYRRSAGQARSRTVPHRSRSPELHAVLERHDRDLARPIGQPDNSQHNEAVTTLLCMDHHRTCTRRRGDNAMLGDLAETLRTAHHGAQLAAPAQSRQLADPPHDPLTVTASQGGRQVPAYHPDQVRPREHCLRPHRVRDRRRQNPVDLGASLARSRADRAARCLAPRLASR
jgi:hypothetical protein